MKETLGYNEPERKTLYYEETEEEKEEREKAKRGLKGKDNED